MSPEKISRCLRLQPIERAVRRRVLWYGFLAGNRDDHARSHGFLRTASGWRLAPAVDMNPTREMREHATGVGGRRSDVGVDDLLAVRSHFGLVTDAARRIVGEVTDALGIWREVARTTGISRAEQDGVGSAIALHMRQAFRRG